MHISHYASYDPKSISGSAIDEAGFPPFHAIPSTLYQIFIPSRGRSWVPRSATLQRRPPPLSLSGTFVGKEIRKSVLGFWGITLLLLHLGREGHALKTIHVFCFNESLPVWSLGTEVDKSPGIYCQEGFALNCVCLASTGTRPRQREREACNRIHFSRAQLGDTIP